MPKMYVGNCVRCSQKVYACGFFGSVYLGAGQVEHRVCPPLLKRRGRSA